MTHQIQGATAPCAIAAMLGVPRFHSVAAMRAGVRAQVEIEIEHLIAVLDDFDGDPDIEDDDPAEPLLASPEWRPVAGLYSDQHRCGYETILDRGDDREEDVGDECEQTNEDGGNILDDLHDAEDEDTGVGDIDGLAEVMSRDSFKPWPVLSPEARADLDALLARATGKPAVRFWRPSPADIREEINPDVAIWHLSGACDLRPSLRMTRNG